MMYNYPFFSFPHFRRYTPYYPKRNIKTVPTPIIDNKKDERLSSKRTPSGFNFLNNFLHQDDRDDDEDFFNLFGLKLYNDDLLLIGLIFFLYKEDVKDQYLFFALILLLLS